MTRQVAELQVLSAFAHETSKHGLSIHFCCTVSGCTADVAEYGSSTVASNEYRPSTECVVSHLQRGASVIM